jgi:hypothetical protein
MKIPVDLKRIIGSKYSGYFFAALPVVLAAWFKMMAGPAVMPASLAVFLVPSIVFVSLFFGSKFLCGKGFVLTDLCWKEMYVEENCIDSSSGYLRVAGCF